MRDAGRMAYDEELANRLRTALQDVDGVREMRMFGGLAFLVGGHLAVAASGQGGIVLRVPPEHSSALTAQPHAERMVMRGKEMDGWRLVAPAGVESDEALQRWTDLGVRYATSLPPK